MDKDLFPIYRTLGKIQKAVAKAETLEEAYIESLRVIKKDFECDYVVTWHALDNESRELRPLFWLGDVDFSGKKISSEQSAIGQVFTSGQAVRHLNYTPGTDPALEEVFSGVSIGSAVCVPMSSGTDSVGCILLVNRADNRAFSEEHADIFEILANLIALEIDENDNLVTEWPYTNVMISANDVKKTYINGEHASQVLKGVNLDVYEGEFLVILGESGCGKSTFLNIIGGMDTLTDGSFTFMGKDMSHVSQSELTKYRRENIGFIFQSYNLMPNLTAAQNLDLIAELVDDPMPTLEALELVGLKDKARNYPATMSGGQQQRVSIARALVKRPKLIFADEPTAALDYTTSIEVLSALENVVKSGTTLVMVTHNEEITRMANRVIRLRGGKLYETKINKKPAHATELVW